MIGQQERLNLRAFGWANGMMNVAYIAGKMRRSAQNPRLLLIQQTPALEQSIPVMLDAPLSETAFPDGTYISVFARMGGRTFVDEAGRAKEGAALLTALHVRYVEAREVPLDVAQLRLQKALSTMAPAATRGDLKALDIDTPPELEPFGETKPAAVDGMAVDPDERVSMLKGSNVVKVAGIIGFMEHRPANPDLPKGQSTERLTLYVQQHGDLSRAVPVRIYGRQASAAVDFYQPGSAIFVAGQLLVDVKKNPEGELRMTPYIKTFSVELAQPMVHIRTSPYPEWALALYNKGKSAEGFAQLTARIKPAKAAASEMQSRGPVAATATGDAE